MKNHLFVTGGPVPHDSPLYIVRSADEQARRHLERMEYITIIEPKQQGKTSLIHFLAHTLGNEYLFAYVNAMRLDKTDEISWYASLYRQLLPKMRIIPEIDRILCPRNGSTWGDFIIDLTERAEKTGYKLIIALDELGDIWMDWRLGFFSNIRAVFDEHPNGFRHLTFVLAGTYNPRTLISDPRTSPFNVAQRVHLPDFTLDQTVQLVTSLGLSVNDTVAIAKCIHDWADGQPYLTQRLCRTISEGEIPASCEGVDMAVDCLYRDDANHLPRILEGLDPEKQPRLRDYVQKILGGHRPQFRPVSEGRYHGPLALIGVIKADEQGFCKVRNRIYELALRRVAETYPEPRFISSDSFTPASDGTDVEVASLKRQLKQLNQNLLIIQEKKVSFVDPRNVPSDWEESEKLILEEIAQVRSRLTELETA